LRQECKGVTNGVRDKHEAPTNAIGAFDLSRSAKMPLDTSRQQKYNAHIIPTLPSFSMTIKVKKRHHQAKDVTNKQQLKKSRGMRE